MAYTLGHTLAMQTYCVLSVVVTFAVTVSVCMSQQTYDIYPEAICLNRTNNSTCLTLSNAVNERDKYFTSQATLVFHDGEHILQGEVVSVSKISNFTLQGYSGSGSGLSSPMITCVDSSLSFSDTMSLQITSIIFNHCRIVLSHATTVIQDSRFENGSTTGNGGALAIFHSNVSFNGFSSFVGNMAEEYGGAIYSDRSDLMFSGSVIFQGSSAWSGGAVYCYEHNNLSFSGDSKFMSNTARWTGAAVYAEDSNTLKLNGDGNFMSNTAGWTGGAVYVGISNTLSFSGDSNFMSNTAEYGGAVYAEGSNIFNFDGDSNFMSNTARWTGGAVYAGVSNTLSFSGNGNFMSNTAGDNGGAVYARGENTLNFSGDSTFMSNTAFRGAGGAVRVENSNTLSFSEDSSFINNTARWFGGVVYAGDGNILNFSGDNSFTNNIVIVYGGAVYARDRNTLNFSGNSSFTSNTAESGGGAVYATDENTLSFSGDSSFMSNTAGAVHAFFGNSLSFSGDSSFLNNTADDGGAVRAYVDNSLSFHGSSIFMNNTGDFGGAVSALDGNRLNFNGNNSFMNNTANDSGGALYIQYSMNTLSFSGNTVFMSNTAGHGGALYAHDVNTLSYSSFFRDTAGCDAGTDQIGCSNNNIVSVSGSSSFISNTARDGGGGAVNSKDGNTLNFNGDSMFVGNTADYGGAVAAEGSLITFNGNTNIEGNEAEQGGGIFLSSKNVLNLIGCVLLSSNMAAFGGGGFVQDGSIEYTGTIAVTGNTAYKDGGGLFINSSSIAFHGAGHFQDNVANDSGGAIFTDSSNVSFRGSFQITENAAKLGGGLALYFGTVLLEPEAEVIIDNNQALRHGGAVYLKNNPLTILVSKDTTSKLCLLDKLEESYKIDRKIYLETTNVFLRFHNNAAFDSGDTLYGGNLEAHVVCSDSYSEQGLEILQNIPECNQTVRNVTLYPGQVLLMPKVAVGQTNGTAPSVTATSQEDLRISTELILSRSMRNMYLSSDVRQENLNIFSEDVCSLEGDPLKFSIEFLTDCPLGFPHYEGGTCVCDKRLQKYTQNCNFQTLTITRLQDDTFWVGVEGSEGLILHPHCPFDYCTTESVTFPLNSTDMQCANGRSGLLCGACQPGHSLALGSSRCLSDCSNGYLALLLVFSFSGVALVAFLFLCHLTVAEGTLSGLIFYANVLAVNQTVFVPSGERNFLTVFIAWLNLDLGIETCFFESLDTYYSTWLQFAFPLYVWVMVGAIIVLANRSVVFAKIIGSANPVAVLATLFLLSYTQLLRAIMTAFSFTTLDYPDGEKFVWLYDGNIGYLDRHDGRHVGLFIFSFLFLLFIFLPYTLLLLCGQWIQRKLSWLSSRKKLYLNSFLDAYYGPYKEEHRYWTGLLLLFRFVTLFVTTVINIRNPQDPFSNLLVTFVVSLVAFSWVVRGLYKKWYLDLLDASFIFNLIVLVGTTYHVRLSGGNQSAVVNTSVGLVFVTFVGIVTIAVIQRVKEKLPDHHRTALRHRFLREDKKQNDEEHSVPTAIPMTTVTYSIVGIGDTQTEQKNG